MAETFDAIVVGAGVIGASTAFHLAKLGGLKVCVIERGPVCSGGTAKSCAIVRSHYSVPTNTQLTVKSIEMFGQFQDWLEDNDAESGFTNSGYIIVAPEGDFADTLTNNLAMQAGVGADTFEISKEEALERHPLLSVEDAKVIGYEPGSGYADPYLTTTSFLNAARRKGATVKTECAATSLVLEGGKVMGVETAQGTLHADTVVVAIGPWSRSLTGGIGLDIPLEVSRHTVLTLRSGEAYGRTLPIVKDLATDNKMYFRPATGGVVLAGTGDHGDSITNADSMDENVEDDFILYMGELVAHRMPSFAEAQLTDSWVGAYDITPDWNPVLGFVPGIGGLMVNFGFSGHGFKLAPSIGKVQAQTALGLATDVDISGYGLDRFETGRLLTGAYGIGSIS
ncbi:MAG: amino acid dehydrogenase [Rhodospirillaceae bacterium]|nr:amino acid dehydrogenase [Rhodospirillaceae bacterium]|tara:strand:- start:1275 stop:2462 length:1188 start_codon:yes stop_codon:yes gene_type:complete